ncbi:MAG: baeRF3 domain-containing protein, partial [Gemmatimonadota bacterium]
LQAPERFWILALSQNEVRLWEGTVSGLTPVNLESVPTNLREALGFQIEKDRLSMHSSGGHGNKPMFHGHGAGKDDTKSELEQFFRTVDAGVQTLLADEIGPIILAAVDYYHPIYRSISKLENLAPDGIVGNVNDWAPPRLHGAAWPIAQAGVDRKIDKALKLWENSYGRGKVESDLAAVARLSVAGRIRLLLTEKERTIWGLFDPETGSVEVIQEGGADPGGSAVDLVDEIAEISLQHGGRALALSRERMPTDTGLAAVLR